MTTGYIRYHTLNTSCDEHISSFTLWHCARAVTQAVGATTLTPSPQKQDSKVPPELRKIKSRISFTTTTSHTMRAFSLLVSVYAASLSLASEGKRLHIYAVFAPNVLPEDASCTLRRNVYLQSCPSFFYLSCPSYHIYVFVSLVTSTRTAEL